MWILDKTKKQAEILEEDAHGWAQKKLQEFHFSDNNNNNNPRV